MLIYTIYIYHHIFDMFYIIIFIYVHTHSMVNYNIDLYSSQ